MKIKLVYPRWPKLPNQPEFHLPPHGPVVFAAAIPREHEISFCDEHVQTLDFAESADLICISCMLTCQTARAWEIADAYRALGKKVVLGGIATMLHAEESAQHADAVFIGEAEGHFEKVLADFERGELKKTYNFFGQWPDLRDVGPARRDILNREAYNYRGVQMVDLVHCSRGCRFDCFPCCVAYLGGQKFRPRPFERVIEELESIPNNRLFIVDNSLAQDDDWERELFRAIAPLKKKWVSHPIRDKDDILDLAAEAGCWYVYQSVIDTSDFMRTRIKRYHDRGIGVEGTIILGLDDHDEDYIKRLVDFLLECRLDLAEFTVVTPFPHTPIRAKMEREGRILHNDWKRYTAGETVFKPAKMSVDKLNEMYQYAWDTFYRDEPKEIKMGKLYRRVLEKEMADGTFRSHRATGGKWGH
ncbi:MAG TPA: radical SAM protein [Verrucomicrobia bacterium]|nr:MAG: radical SAM protein [Lentisphaerae bacterium GWF2_57_35]HBA83337.1 radical SAM protein [Verrucomicrobiota bacterium]